MNFRYLRQHARALLLLSFVVTGGAACGSESVDCAITSTCVGSELPGQGDASTDRSVSSDGSLKSDASAEGAPGDASADVLNEQGEDAQGNSDVATEATADAGSDVVSDARSEADVQDAAPTITCEAGTAVCADRCVSLKTDLENCGACGHVCPGDAGTQACSAGVCCAKNLAVCGGACSDPLKDKNNCGGCGQVCAGVCSEGKCCPTGQTNCSGTCVDLQKDIAHCGTCEKKCVAPTSDGVAQCVSAVCGIKCDNLQCGSQCCDKPRPNMHRTSCQAGACGPATCDKGSLVCVNKEDGGSLTGQASCAGWTFESATTEGWQVDAEPAFSPAAVGNLLVIKNQDEFGADAGPNIGAYSLAIKFDGTSGRSVRFKVPLCSSGGVDVGLKHLKARVRMSEPGAPSGTQAWLTAQVMTTDARDRSDAYGSYAFGTLAVESDWGSWISVDMPIAPDQGQIWGQITTVALGFWVGGDIWVGTIYLDQLSIE